MTAKVPVHADGGDCHGTPLVAGRCPGCGIAPDMQSVEVWLIAKDERKPSTGWEYSRRDDLWRLQAGDYEAKVYRRRSDGRWVYVVNGRGKDTATQLAAQLAAEDALLEIASVIVQAVRR